MVDRNDLGAFFRSRIRHIRWLMSLSPADQEYYKSLSPRERDVYESLCVLQEGHAPEDEIDRLRAEIVRLRAVEANGKRLAEAALPFTSDWIVDETIGTLPLLDTLRAEVRRVLGSDWSDLGSEEVRARLTEAKTAPADRPIGGA